MAKQISIRVVDSNSKETGLVFRPMRFEDLEAVHRIERQSFSSPWSIGAFLAELAAEHSRSWVVEKDEKIVGYAIGWFIADEFHLNNIAVDRRARRHGIASFMLERMLQIAREAGVRIIRLEVRRSNTPAIHLYKKYGFKVEGVRKNYYQREQEDALLMSFELKET